MVDAMARTDEMEPDGVGVFGRDLLQQLVYDVSLDFELVGEFAVGDDNEVNAFFGVAVFDGGAPSAVGACGI